MGAVLIALILTTIALGLSSGTTEGMVMIPAGVRTHPYFSAYHAIDIAAYGLCAALAVMVWTSWPGWVASAGLAILLWETREIGYSVARWGKAVTEHEHITFADIISYNLEGRAVRSLHGARLLTAALLLLVGGLQ